MSPALAEILVPLYPWLAVALGLLLGSFYNVCVHRWLSGESIVFPGSKCPHCSHTLAAWENLPVVSFLLLKGRCRACKEPISWRYPVVELVSGLWALGLALKFPLDMAPGVEHWVLGVFAVHMAVGGMLIVASFIDFDSYLLPDVITLPGTAVALAGAYFVLRPALGTPTLTQSLVGMAVGAGLFLVLQLAFRYLKKMEGLGTGTSSSCSCSARGWGGRRCLFPCSLRA